MRRQNAVLRPIVLSIAASLGACMSLPAAAQNYGEVAPAAADIGTADAEVRASSYGSIAIGSNAMANTVGTGNYGTAVGAGSQAQGYSSVALGPVAVTNQNAFGSVALGL